MRNLLGIGTALMLTAAAPIVMEAQIDRGTEARGVYDHVKTNGSFVIFKLDGKEIPGRYWEMPSQPREGRTAFFALESGDMRYLVVNQTFPSNGTSPYRVLDIIDRSVDGVVDRAIQQNGIGPREEVDLSDRTRRFSTDALYNSGVSLAYIRTRPPIPEPGRLQIPRR